MFTQSCRTRSATRSAKVWSLATWHGTPIRHRPVIDRWQDITTPVVVAAGVDDASAASIDDLVARLPSAVPLVLPGDHINAVASPEFTNAIIRLADGRSSAS